MSPDTRDRILDGAVEAVARHGLAKLDMRDVSATSGVSRGTLYRYFPGRRALLAELARREGLRFKAEMLAAIEAAPRGPERILVALQHATRHVREHRALQRLLETDPAFVLRGLRAELPRIARELQPVLGPLLADVEPVRRGVATAEQLVEWMLRLMISAFLLPASDPDDMARGLTATYRVLTAHPSPQARRRKRAARVVRRSRA